MGIRDRLTLGSSARRPGRRNGNFGAAHVDPGDAYAGVPILQTPLWHNEIAAYFFLGGISSGAFILGALADLAGTRWRSLAQTARLVSFAAMTPCVPLLVAELGRPSRFHHMLRIFKPSSPMNLGAWTLLAHSGFSSLLAAHVLADRGKLPIGGRLARLLPAKLVGTAGIAPAMTLGGYSGVLIGTTSVPVWSNSPVLGGLFMASAIATGTSAVSLASIVSGRDTPAEHAALGSIGMAAGAAELCLTASYLATSGEAAKPLLEGADGALLLGAATATATALALDLVGTRGHANRRVCSALAASATLAGGAMLRWAVVRAGRLSAADRDATLATMRPSRQNPGWGPPSAAGSVA